MVSKLNFLGAEDEIEEILLSQGEVISALKLTQENANLRKYLQTAQNTDDPSLFHSTFYYFKSKPQHVAALRKGNLVVNSGANNSNTFLFR